MSTTTPFSTLEAVNEMLMSIGQAPVNSLSVSVGDVNIAQSVLGIETRYVLLYGFAFNTDTSYPLTPDINKFIALPAGALRCDPTDSNQDLVIRRHPTYGMGFWDRANQTWQMGAAVPCEITWGYSFEDLPETARNYIAISAVRKFQKRTIGAPELDGFSQEDQARAWALLLRDERRVRGTNSFKSSKSLQRTTYRNGWGIAGNIGPVTS
ncbi:hypothetical protein EOE18_15290 [Novosphingobium umbonatum]|uniref:Uncharacterized protein n=1 Tax=Novosphingobium umbonatum TaxID=1908524 RepID=A0A3S2UPE0_9SPHN|nr:hypothetical protein [Novosphingobium umbonatum]RVU03485.1 hypothetical protein EOE18_15290 [Novosphingobium umbonatum]